MKRRIKVIVMAVSVLLCLTVTQGQCHAANWLSVATNKDDLSEWYIDIDSIKVDKKSFTIIAWTKVNYPTKEFSINLALFNYKGRYFQWLQLEWYDPDGKHKHIDGKNEIIYIPPGSVMEIVFNKLLEITALK